MENKYNLDFYESMEVANGYLDKLYDELHELKDSCKNEPEKLEYKLYEFKEEYTREKNNFEEMIDVYLETKDYQSVGNMLVLYSILEIMLGGNEIDMSEAEDYLESLYEEMFIYDIPHSISITMAVIDRHNNWEVK